MNLPKALGFVRRWLPFLILGPLLGGVAAFLVLREIPPIYQARVTLLVGQGTSVTGTGADELSGAEQLAQTYAEIVRTRPVLEEAAGKLNLTIPVRDLQQRVGANLVRGTQLLRITGRALQISRHRIGHRLRQGGHRRVREEDFVAADREKRLAFGFGEKSGH